MLPEMHQRRLQLKIGLNKTLAWSLLHVICFPDDGRLHKAINAKGKVHIIEELTLFRESQPVQHIELDAEKVWKSVS